VIGAGLPLEVWLVKTKCASFVLFAKTPDNVHAQPDEQLAVTVALQSDVTATVPTVRIVLGCPATTLVSVPVIAPELSMVAVPTPFTGTNRGTPPPTAVVAHPLIVTAYVPAIVFRLHALCAFRPALKNNKQAAMSMSF
jgi:hypothetical protein